METHKTHKMRYSDSSYYDEVCNNCGQPDWCSKDNPKLSEPCVDAEEEDETAFMATLIDESGLIVGVEMVTNKGNKKGKYTIVKDSK